jgi:hypothetical protein
VSGWTADNPDDANPAAGAGWSAAPPPSPPSGDAGPPAWAAPEAPAVDAAWAMPEVGTLGGEPTATATTGWAGRSGRGPDADGWDDSPEPVAPPVLPVALKAMTATDIVDGAWGIIKARPKTVFAITAMILLPTEVLAAYLSQGGSTYLDLGSSLDSSLSTGGSSVGEWGIYVAALVQNLSLFFVGAAIAVLVSSWYAGGDLTARQAVGAALRRAPALLGAFAVLLPIKIATLLTCGVAIPFVVPLLMVTAPAIAIEGLGPIAGPMRSFRLAKRRYWPCIGIWCLALVIELTVNIALSLVPALVSSIVPGPLAPVVAAAGTVFGAFVTAPFVVGVCVLLYLDLRVRTEGLDLELDADAVFARAA